jgi:hypothetical protein
MGKGKYNSSSTRVQPAFKQLSLDEETRVNWLGRLLLLGSRAETVGLPSELGWPGKLLKPPKFEYPVKSPPDYLKWLVQHPCRLRWPKTKGKEKRFAPITMKNRQALLAGDDATKKEALSRLETDSSPGNWWVFEGRTFVDCALLAKNVTVFVEGKRTEPHLTDKIEWDPERDQVCRNLDCLRVYEQKAKRYYVLLIVEEASSSHEEAKRFDTEAGYEVARKSCPHLKKPELDELWKHYLGHTTWEKLEKEFGLSFG